MITIVRREAIASSYKSGDELMLLLVLSVITEGNFIPPNLMGFSATCNKYNYELWAT